MKNEIESMRSCERAIHLVEDALRNMDNDTVVLSVGVPWKSILIPTQAKYVIYPSTRGGYNIQAVPVEVGKKECKKPFPENWRGKTQDELVNLIGIEGVGFCHPGGYLMNTDTLEQALYICKKLV